MARALDEDNYLLIASLDLSAELDMVNIYLLVVRLRVLPDDLVAVIEICLKDSMLKYQILNLIFMKSNQAHFRAQSWVYTIFVLLTKLM